MKITRSSLLHLRIPFAFFLMPVYLLALVTTPGFIASRAAIAFIAVHLFMYPGSSGFNAYYDRDTGSIGMLEHPPAVTADLLRLSLFMKVSAVIVALFSGPAMAIGCLLYGVVSILYSWDRVRLKKYPVIGWLLTGTGQGFILFFAIVATIAPEGTPVLTPEIMGAGGSMALMMLAASPLLEIFQHEEDAKRGDLTISRLLGVQGTLLFSGVLFTIAATALFIIVTIAEGTVKALLLPIAFLPGIVLFVRLFINVRVRGAFPAYRSIMPVMIAASIGLNGFLGVLLLLRRF